MMERLFPPALLTCIGEARAPHPHELLALADKICREVFAQPSELERRQALHIARTALAGHPLVA